MYLVLLLAHIFVLFCFVLCRVVLLSYFVSVLGRFLVVLGGLGGSWAALGRLLGGSWGVLGASWAVLGRLAPFKLILEPLVSCAARILVPKKGPR